MRRETLHAPVVHVGDESLLLGRVEPHAVRVAEAVHASADLAQELARLIELQDLRRRVAIARPVGAPLYVMKKRGIFKTMVVRTDKGAQTLDFSPDEIAEIEYRFAALKPYLTASIT